MSGYKLTEGLCPDCGCPPSERGREGDESGETLGDICTHPCHDAAEIGAALDEDAAAGCEDAGLRDA